MGRSNVKVAIVGAGAMGAIYGFFLRRAGHEVVLVDIWREHVEAINRAGLEMEEEGTVHRVAVKATTDASEAGPADLVVVFVKSYHTVAAAESARRVAGPETLVLTLQNGLGNAETLGAGEADWTPSGSIDIRFAPDYSCFGWLIFQVSPPRCPRIPARFPMIDRRRESNEAFRHRSRRHRPASIPGDHRLQLECTRTSAHIRARSQRGRTRQGACSRADGRACRRRSAHRRPRC